MLVRDIMRHPVITIGPDTTLEEAFRTMRAKSIRHLPVVQADRLVGVITDRDLRLATSGLLPDPFPPGSRVGGILSREPRTAGPSDPIEDAARVMREEKIGCLPVMEGGRLVGIITNIDLLDALMRMTGVDKPSGRLEARLADRPGEIARLIRLLAERNLSVRSILTYPDSADSVRIVLRIGSIEVRRIAQELRGAGFDVLWPPEKPCLR